MNQVMSDQVSFGSQLQYVPQALFAQTAPVMIPPVRSGHPMAIIRYVTSSMTSCFGTYCARSFLSAMPFAHTSQNRPTMRAQETRTLNSDLLRKDDSKRCCFMESPGCREWVRLRYT